MFALRAATLITLAAVPAAAIAEGVVTLQPGLYAGTTTLSAANPERPDLPPFEDVSPLGPKCLTATGNTLSWEDYVPVSDTISQCAFTNIDMSDTGLTTDMTCDLHQPEDFYAEGQGELRYTDDSVTMTFAGIVKPKTADTIMNADIEIKIARTGACN